MGGAIAIAVLVALLWLCGRDWEHVSPYPPVRLSGESQHAAVDRLAGPGTAGTDPEAGAAPHCG